MNVKFVKYEDFVNYYKCSMFIGAPSCTFKCGIENCQNSSWKDESIVSLSDEQLITNYFNNPMTSAIIFGGLEPLDNFIELKHFINRFRKESDDDIVIYTGYEEYEIIDKILELSTYKNIIVKFGRYKRGDQPHYDPILKVNLASDNQYAKNISEASLFTKLNNNKALVDHIRQVIKNNDGYCCCAIVKTPDKICPCADFRNQESPGLCHCGLYEKFKKGE